jgi:hypothetical protein
VTAEFHGAPGHPEIIVLVGANQTTEVRRASDGALLLGPGVVVHNFSLDPNESVFVLSYGDTSTSTRPSELRRTSDGSLIRVLDGVAVRATFSPGPESQSFVVTYEQDDGTRSELRRSTDGAALAELSAEADGVDFSPDPKASVFVARYLSETGEIRRTADGSIVTLLGGTFGEAGAVAFSDDGSVVTVGFDISPGGQILHSWTGDVIAPLSRSISSATSAPGIGGPVLVQYYEGASELRSTSDGHVISELPDGILYPGRTFKGDAGGKYFAVQLPGKTELRRQATAEVVDIPDSDGTTELAELVRIGGNGDDEYILGTYPDGHREIRRIANLALVEHLGSTQLDRFQQSTATDGIFWPDLPGADGFIVDDGSQPAEIRRLSDAALVGTLSESALDDVVFSHDGKLAVARSKSGSGELVRLESGEATVFAATVTGAVFSGDSRLVLVTLGNGRSELWDTDGKPRRLVDLGLRVGGEAFVPGTSRVAVRYLSGDAYLIDADWLRAMGGNARGLSSERLESFACDGPIATVGIADNLLQPYMGDGTARACN